MWFKNAQVYRLTKNFDLSPEEFAEKLDNKRFEPCSRQAEESVGWVSPIHRSKDYLVHAAGNCVLFCMRREQKVIPASAVKENLEERVAVIEEETGRKVYSKEKQSLKEDILSQMLPQAFVRSTHIWSYFDTRRGFLIINAASDKVTDLVFELLVESIGSFGAVKLISKDNPVIKLNQWVENGLPEGWELTGDYELKDLTDDRIAKFKDNEAENAVLGDLLEDGYSVNKLGFRYHGRFKGILTPELVVKSIKFTDELLEENEDVDGEDPLARFDADFALMSSTLGEFIEEITIHFDVPKE